MPGLLSAALALLASAHAGPDGSLGVSVATGTVGQSGVLAYRMRFGSGLQLGARVEGSLVSGWYLDGWEVRDGTALAGVLSTSLPLVRGDSVRVDLEVDGGVRGLAASDTDAPTDRALVVLADVAPMVTIPLGGSFAGRLGWKQITHIQVRPSTDLEAQGALMRGTLMCAPDDDIQVGLDGAVGGVFGFGGDGGKALAQAAVVVRWVPGAARTFTNH